MIKVLVINGAYRDKGMTDQVLSVMIEALNYEGIDSEVILLREKPIEFCLNCRKCTQQPGRLPGQCVHRDEMQTFINKIEAADAYILASPTNFGSVTAIFQRFMERLIVYTYWPGGARTPKLRRDSHAKKAVLVSSCAAPGMLGRWTFHTHSQLKMAAKVIGATSVGTLFTGLVGEEEHPSMSKRTEAKASALVLKLR